MLDYANNYEIKYIICKNPNCLHCQNHMLGKKRKWLSKCWQINVAYSTSLRHNLKNRCGYKRKLIAFELHSWQNTPKSWNSGQIIN